MKDSAIKLEAIQDILREEKIRKTVKRMIKDDNP